MYSFSPSFLAGANICCKCIFILQVSLLVLISAVNVFFLQVSLLVLISAVNVFFSPSFLAGANICCKCILILQVPLLVLISTNIFYLLSTFHCVVLISTANVYIPNTPIPHRPPNPTN